MRKCDSESAFLFPPSAKAFERGFSRLFSKHVKIARERGIVRGGKGGKMIESDKGIEKRTIFS